MKTFSENARGIAIFLENKRDLKATPGTLDSVCRHRDDLLCHMEEKEPDTSADTLSSWWDNHSRFLLLALLAKKYMCICATSTASEGVQHSREHKQGT